MVTTVGGHNCRRSQLSLVTTVRESEINGLDAKKASVENDIPGKILKECNDIANPYLLNIYNYFKNSNTFPVSLKCADVTPIHKEKETIKKNYSPVSLLPIRSKLYERNMYNSTFLYIEKFLSPHLFGYRNGHSTKQCLIVIIYVQIYPRFLIV